MPKPAAKTHPHLPNPVEVCSSTLSQFSVFILAHPSRK
jgi:hypothetical protein